MENNGYILVRFAGRFVERYEGAGYNGWFETSGEAEAAIANNLGTDFYLIPAVMLHVTKDGIVRTPNDE